MSPPPHTKPQKPVLDTCVSGDPLKPAAESRAAAQAHSALTLVPPEKVLGEEKEGGERRKGGGGGERISRNFSQQVVDNLDITRDYNTLRSGSSLLFIEPDPLILINPVPQTSLHTMLIQVESTHARLVPPSFQFGRESYFCCSSDGLRETLEPLQDIKNPPILREGHILLFLQQRQHHTLRRQRQRRTVSAKKNTVRTWWWAWLISGSLKNHIFMSSSAAAS